MKAFAEFSKESLPFFLERLSAKEPLDPSCFAIAGDQPLALRVGLHVIDQCDDGQDYEVVLMGGKFPGPAAAFGWFFKGEPGFL